MLLLNCGHERALNTVVVFEEKFRSSSNLERQHADGLQCIIAHGHVLPLYILTKLEAGHVWRENYFTYRSFGHHCKPPSTPSQCAQMCVH
jgi:hypothetical protein